jgi:hypothetical protein
MKDLLGDRVASPVCGTSAPQHRWGMEMDEGTGDTQIRATITCVPPAGYKAIDPGRNLQHRREICKRATKFIDKNRTQIPRSLCDSALPGFAQASSNAPGESPGPTKIQSVSDQAQLDKELMALCKGIVQDEELPRLQEWLKTANEQHRRSLHWCQIQTGVPV